MDEENKYITFTIRCNRDIYRAFSNWVKVNCFNKTAIIEKIMSKLLRDEGLVNNLLIDNPNIKKGNQ